MNTGFAKFPTTPHLLWLSEAAIRGDKVLSRADAEEFLRQPVTVEEKVDGANLGISFDMHGNLLAQNRGNLVDRESKGQFATLWRWLSERESRLFDALSDQFILFGEWCYARHSIHYTRLPDLFLAFDVFDNREQRFMSVARRNKLLREIELTAVPQVGVGVFELSAIRSLIGQSSLYDGPMEGIYLRQESDFWLLRRAKVVRPEFVQQINDHWTDQPLILNQLAT